MFERFRTFLLHSPDSWYLTTLVLSVVIISSITIVVAVFTLLSLYSEYVFPTLGYYPFLSVVVAFFMYITYRVRKDYVEWRKGYYPSIKDHI